jgi:hypothetical protein
VLHDQSGSAKKGRPKSARGEGPKLANDRLWHCVTSTAGPNGVAQLYER